MFRDGKHISYQYDLSDRELRYWMDIFFHDRVESAVKLDLILSKSTDQYTMVVPKLTD
jgi:hypothetical protein